MLLLDTETLQIDGVTIFPDHADPKQFYYLPLAPHLTVRTDGAGAELPVFSLIRFRGGAGNGGFVNFDVDLGLPPARVEALKSRVAQTRGLADPHEVRLAPVTVVDGSVRLILLDADDSPAPSRPGPAPAPRFVEKISHAAKPSLYGDNRAAFSVALTQDGIQVIESSLDGEILPIAVIYSLDYLGLRPAWSVRLSIDWDRVQTHMDESFGVDTLILSSEIASAVDELIDKRAITFEVDSFVTDDETAVAGRRDAAAAQVRAMMTDAFFAPSLPPWKPDAGEDWANSLQKVGDVIGMIAAGPAASVTSSALFSYKKTDYRRTDRKSLNVNLSERVTVKRSIFPQAHLAGMFDLFRRPGFDRSRHVIDVDLDDPWFKRRRLAVSALVDFQDDRIGAINVRARYGDEPKNLILTRAAPSGAFDWPSRIEGTSMAMPVEVSFEVIFQGVDATERPRALAAPARIETGEQIVIDPRELYAISTVPVVAVGIPWAAYPQVEVHLRYTDDAHGLAETEVLRLHENAEQAQWPMFVLDRQKRAFEVRRIYHAASHIDHDSGWQTEEDGAVTVTDPFPRKRSVSVIAALDWTQVDRCFVDLSCPDPAGGAPDLQSLELVEGDHSKKVTFDRTDPARQRVEYGGVILFKDGRSVEIPASATVSPRILIRPDIKGHKLVEIVPPPDLAAAHLLRITADLRFEDFMANLSFTDQEVFEQGTPAKLFEYDYADPARARFELRTSFLFDNGLQKQTDWQALDQPVVRLSPQ